MPGGSAICSRKSKEITMSDIQQRRQREIRAAMVKRGICGAAIARKLGVTRQAVCLVISGRSKSQRIIDALIEAGAPKKLFQAKEQKNGAAKTGEKA